MSVQIDPRAAVSPKAKLGENVSVGPFAVIEDDVVIGDGTWIGPHVVIWNGARVGRQCRIFPGASVSGAPQDLKYQGEPTTLEVGDNTVVRECATLNRGTMESGTTVIGSNCLFMAYSHVAHDCKLGSHVILANCCALGGHVQLGDWVIIGGLTPVHQFVHIGGHTMIGGGFRVTKDVPPFILAGQDPLMFEGLNSLGLKRRGFSHKTIGLLEKTYDLVYRSNLNVTQAVTRIKQELEMIPEVQGVIDFIAQSNRGIIPGKRRS